MQLCIFSDRLYLDKFCYLHWGAQIIFRFIFDSLKYRISVFYMREPMELVYILQNKVELGIVYFL